MTEVKLDFAGFDNGFGERVEKVVHLGFEPIVIKEKLELDLG